jgi:hypothetical protein
MGSQKVLFPFTLVILWAVFCLVACKTTPAAKEDAPLTDDEEWALIQTEEPAAVTPPAQGPVVVTDAYRTATMGDVRIFIEELNRIIRTRNFNAWKAALSQEYFNQISSKEVLQSYSEQPAMKTRGVVLRDAEDYFRHVVVPSRANSRVDDIEFISENRVKVFSIMTNRAGEEQRLRLYDLERTGNTWKIIN